MTTLYFYLWFILKLTLAVTGQSANYVLKGREAVLTPAINKFPDDILWKHNGDKVIQFDGAEETLFEPYHGRITLAWSTAKLTISDVRYEDSGEYELDIFSGQKLYRSQYMLKVLDEVSKPVIRCEMNDENSTITSATLFCSSPSNTPEALTFIWRLEGQSELGQTLPITLGDGHDDITYSCTANNPLQEETSTFIAKDCYTERTSEPLNILVPIIIASLILLAFCIFPIIFRHQIKRVCLDMRKNDDCEKQLKAADESVKIKDEHDPLLASNIHRQETMLSSQRLPQQEYVTEETQGRSKNIREIFENHENAETLSGKGNYAIGATSFPNTAPGPGQMDTGGERDLQHKELNNVPITMENEDTDSKLSDENENAAPEPQSTSSEPQANQDIESTSSEQGSSVQTESEKEPEQHHKDHEDEPKIDENEFTKALEQTAPPSSEPQVNQDIKSTPLEQESSVQTDPEKQPDENHKDNDDEQKMKAARSSNSIETDSDESTKALEEKELSAGSGSTEQTNPDADSNTETENKDPQNDLSNKEISVSQPQSAQSEDKKSDEESKTDGQETNVQREPDQDSETSDDKGTEETQPQNEPPDTQSSETSALQEQDMDQTLLSESSGVEDSPRNSSENVAEKTETAESEKTAETSAAPKPGKDQTPESSGVESKDHDKSNTETQKQDSACNPSEDEQEMVTAESEKIGSNEQVNKSPNTPASPPSQTTDNDKENKNTGEDVEDDKKEKKDEPDKESGSSGSEQSNGVKDIPG
ncbi:clumping factor A-like isoform X3 [Boleophthalmus pectinirostris]|uniref:clumping factor A-like isoform X3 n=1 Tax=Boleophthalmus pectinirostris TaxID=150288 RepID=UPI00242FC9E5|nr:clumping factor A-like isoform X3 [Boleophthalmus pectinirostris]